MFANVGLFIVHAPILAAQMDRAAALWASYAYVLANLDAKLPRLNINTTTTTGTAAGGGGARREKPPTQAELDEIFGKVSLGLPTNCPASSVVRVRVRTCRR